MPASVLRNSRNVSGVTSINIAGDTATVQVERGSELDGLLLYNATRGGKPMLVLKDEHFEHVGRFDISHAGDTTYTLKAPRKLES